MADHRIRVTYQFRTFHALAEVRCNACGWCVIYPASSIERLFPRALTLDMARSRLRCRWCGKKDAKLVGVRLAPRGISAS